MVPTIVQTTVFVFKGGGDSPTKKKDAHFTDDGTTNKKGKKNKKPSKVTKGRTEKKKKGRTQEVHWADRDSDSDSDF